ncbi:MAG: GntR family transcriptional regulator [Candidatus Omnitrophica bacterium]|nr:GntR family transcriptional regulator [Candidatus Omnitrophota bacterium]
MIEIGKFNRLEVTKLVSFGIYLEGGHEFGEILLPARYVPRGVREGDHLDVFITTDSEDRWIATTEKPYAQAGQFAYLQVIEVNDYGAFLDWGLSKHLLLPFSEQKTRVQAGDWRTVRVFLDERTQRVAASSKIDRFLGKTPPRYSEGQEVDLLICSRTELGWRAIVDDAHWGLIQEHEIFEKLQGGMRRRGYVRAVREDGKIDLALNRPGYGAVGSVAEEILTMLQAQGGYLPLSDATAPEVIYGLFRISKKTFKKALGDLYRRRLIRIEDDGIRLN